MLLLSKFAGAAEELVDAVLTNPFHARGVARDLDRCLRMSIEERRRRHAPLFDVVTRQTAQVWGSSFIDALESVRKSVPLGVECPGDAAA